MKAANLRLGGCQLKPPFCIFEISTHGTEPPGYARTLYEQQDNWLRNRHPLAVRIEDLPADKLVWDSGSIIQAVPKVQIKSDSITRRS